MESRMYTKPQYKCGVCGKIYDSIIERAQCEVMCVKKQEEEAKKAAELKKQEEQETRHKEVTDAYDHFCELLKKYNNDYGALIVNGNSNIPSFSKLIDHFWF